MTLGLEFFSKMSDERIRQMATSLFLHSHIASDGAVRHRALRLEELVKRVAKHGDCYESAVLPQGFETGTSPSL